MPAGREPASTRPRVDAGKLWAGGIATAVVAALVALVGVLVCRWLFNVPLLSPKSDGAYGDVHTTTMVLVAAGAALLATGLAHLLLLGTPRPMTFFGWIIGLATVLAVLLPFSTSAPLDAKIATAAVDLVLGICIGSLISGVASRSVRIRPPGGSAYMSSDPVAPERLYGEPSYRQPRYDEPGYREPGYGEPRYDEPRYDEPRYDQRPSSPGLN